MEFYSPIAVRAFAVAKNSKSLSRNTVDIGHSEWSLTVDTETTTDAAQRLRFGVFQLRRGEELRKCGIFFDPDALKRKERYLLQAFATEGLELMNVREFIEEAFFPYVYDLDALCIGFNLPFDLSRLAIGHSPARGHMRGGFSFQLSENKYRPRLQIKHLDNRAALIQFAQPAQQQSTRRMRRLKSKIPARRGYFLDVKTLAAALFSRSWSLESLAKFLKTKNLKHSTEEHGQNLTEHYLRYAAQDVQVTWECFQKLRLQYDRFGLSETPITRIYSEAGLGKAYLKQMGIKPWRETQPDFPPELLGAIMSSYYGGRAEVHIRKQTVQVLYCDFLSMYPTVCTLMDLWKFVIAERMEIQEATAEVTSLFRTVRMKDLRNPKYWKHLNVLVQVRPKDDILPVRAPYSFSSNQLSIGVNHLTSEKAMWFTLADCIASTLLNGRAPQVVKALRFVPIGVQRHLAPINLMGNRAYRVDPTKDDFYKLLIDLRSEVKGRMKTASGEAREELDTEQAALKICANATSYGIFVELNTKDHDGHQKVTCYGYDKPFETSLKTVEEAGRYFHPIIATLITGAARLMLAMTESLTTAAGITWAFCDTDSMALAKPDDMSETEFLKRALKVQEWFTPLNPYENKGPLLKIEDINYGFKDGKTSADLIALYCWAVSAKRYALFNRAENGKPLIRKASANGLGHLLPPYESKKSRNAPALPPELRETELKEWQHDYWVLIVEAALSGRYQQLPLVELDHFDSPGVSRYAATTPALLGWFRNYNTGKPYCDHVKPFNFLLAFQPQLDLQRITADRISELAPVAPYDSYTQKAVRRCFDRKTGNSVPRDKLKSYKQLLNQYHLHPESKFTNGDYLDSGFTSRRHVVALGIEHIGKEANRLEEQWYLGAIADAQIHYGFAPDDLRDLIEVSKKASRQVGRRIFAGVAGISAGHLDRILKGHRLPSKTIITRLQKSVRIFEGEDR